MEKECHVWRYLKTEKGVDDEDIYSFYCIYCLKIKWKDEL